MHYLKGRKALISGGASGIGGPIAAKLIQEEVAAAVANINLTGEMPSALQAYTCNVVAGTGVDLLFASVQTNPGAPDILICNASRGIHKKLIKDDQAQLARRVTETDLTGKLRLVRAFGPAVRLF